MPELPEVETVKEVLKKLLIGSKFTKITVLYKRMILSSLDTFESSLIDKTITDVSRKGKFLIIHFEDKTVLISHLRMEGKFYECQSNEDVTPYARVIFSLSDGRRMCYDDSRKFGIMKVSTEDKYLIEEPISKLGPEPFEVNDPNYLFNKYSHIKKPIKEAILDQSILAGIGNIYADETLYRCHLHPLRPANTLDYNDCKNIIEQSCIVLKKAIELGGSTIRSYHAAKGIDGKFQNELLIYGKEGLPCQNNCLAHYKKIFVGGRGTTYCPICQRQTNRPFVIGVTGVIASGKSTIIKYLASKGIKCISSDQIVTDLYKTSEVQTRVCSLLGNNAYENGEVNKAYIKKMISLNAKLKNELQEIIHPLVKEELIKFINDNQNDNILVLEIPLLYESHMEDLVDATMAIDATIEDQKHNLIARGHDVDSYMLLNTSNQFKSYRSKLTFLLETNNKIEKLQSELDKIIKSLK